MESVIHSINSLRDKVDYLEKQNKELKEKINTLEKRVNEKNRILEEKVNEIMSIKFEYEKMKKNEIIKENRLFKDSNIIKLEDENIIMNWFEIKPINFIKLLDSNINGDLVSTFISKCANKCPTILFVKTTNGYRFGGFTTKIWTKGSYADDKKSFLFSLDKKEKYNIKETSLANYYQEDLFQFGGGDGLRLYDKCTSNNKNFITSGGFQVPKNNEINGGEKNFTVFCFEVYQLEY